MRLSRHRKRSGGVLVRTLLAVILLSTAACTSSTEPAQPKAAVPSGTPSPGSATYTRAEPGTEVDVVIRRNGGGRRWVGQWPLDLAGLTLTNGDDWLVVELAFSRLEPEASDIVAGYSVGDSFAVYLDGNGDRRHEREIFVNWGFRGGLLTDIDDQVLRCRFDPHLDRADRAIAMRVPRSCLPHLTRMRARAAFFSARRTGQVVWSATDRIDWTRFAPPGASVSREDPAA